MQLCRCDCPSACPSGTIRRVRSQVLPPRQPSPSRLDGRPNQAHQILGRQLRLLRESRGMSAAGAGLGIAASKSKISRIECGQIGVAETDLHRMLEMYAVTEPHQREALLRFVRELSQPQWWHDDRTVLGGSLCSYLILESLAQHIRTYEVRFVPGLLQTPAYAEAVIRLRYTDTTEIDRRVRVRMQRQKEILRGRTPRLWALVDKAALSEAFPGEKVMREQIEFLRQVSWLPSVSLQVLPSGAGGRRGIGNSFSILRQTITNLSDVVYIEHIGDPLFLDTTAASDPYRQAMEELALEAGKPADTMAELDDALARLGKP
ncbi:helix-turn-helix domain-containing protein [Actinoplanes sp. NPDC048988]